MADFLKAVEWMKEGKKVRRKCWASKSNYWYLEQLGKMHADIWGHHLGEKMNKEVDYFTTDLFQAQDWEIYRAKK